MSSELDAGRRLLDWVLGQVQKKERTQSCALRLPSFISDGCSSALECRLAAALPEPVSSRGKSAPTLLSKFGLFGSRLASDEVSNGNTRLQPAVGINTTGTWMGGMSSPAGTR